MLESQEWYKHLIEDLDSIITQSVKNSREELIRGYHEFGTRLLAEFDNFERSKIYGEKITSRVAESMGKSVRTVERAVSFAKKFPNVEKVYELPEGENISWHKIVNNYLPESKKEIEHKDRLCPNCGFKLN